MLKKSLIQKLLGLNICTYKTTKLHHYSHMKLFFQKEGCFISIVNYGNTLNLMLYQGETVKTYRSGKSLKLDIIRHQGLKSRAVS